MRKLANVTLLVVLTSLLAFATAGVTPVYAQENGKGPGQVVFGRNVHLEAGETVDGDLVVFGGNLTTGAGSRVVGDAVVFGGNVDVAGQVGGNVAAIGGNIHLAATARVQGDAAALGGQVQREAGAQLLGERVETGRFDLSRWLPGGGDWAGPFSAARAANFDAIGLFLRLVRAALVSVFVAVIALLVVLFLPEHARVIGNTVTEATAASFGVGLLTLIVGAALIAVLIITICLAPLGLVLALPLALATLLGWAVVGYVLGQRLMRVLKREAAPAPMITALVGALVLTGVHQGLNVLGDLPCLGFFFWLLGAAIWLGGASIGLGAVVLSRFGTQPYPGAPSPSGGLPSLPAAAPPAESAAVTGEDSAEKPAEAAPAEADVADLSGATSAMVEDEGQVPGVVELSEGEPPAPASEPTPAGPEAPGDTDEQPKPRRRAPRRRKPAEPDVTPVID